ncbi:MAG: hypothetical protein Q7J85_04080 [Bacillota bacterium]|nr:hypothetical protein [Bacillota bacterium]
MNDNMDTNIENNSNNNEQKSGAARQWRVGTFSMGFTLIALGLFLILARVYELPTMGYMMKWWPLLIVVLGLEIVVYNSLANVKRSPVRFTYDFFSIFLVAVVLIFSAGFYFIESSGVFTMAQRFLLSSPHVVAEEKISCPISDRLQALSLEVESGALNLSAYDGDEIKVSIIYKGHFPSREEAETFAAEQYVKQELLGDTLYLKIFSPAVTHHFFNHPEPEQEVTVLIPDRINVDVLRARGDLQLYLQEVNNNWNINYEGRNSIINLEKVTNTTLDAEISERGSIEGNVNWDHFETKHEDDSDPAKPQINAVKRWGNEEHTITLRQRSGTAVINIKNQEE